jgi:pimeloyl-ACP methyl ester carboxylesterase
MRKIPTSLLLLLFCLPGYSLMGQVEMNFDFETPYGDNTEVGKYLDVNGIQMYYEEYGEGEPLLLIHGNAADMHSMGNQIDYFREDYRVIVADSRGHGKSGLNTDSLTYVQMAADWAELARQLNVEEAYVIGWSDGGNIGLLLAINHPETVGKVVTMGANLRPDTTAVYSWAPASVKEAEGQVKTMIEMGDTRRDWDLVRQQIGLLLYQPSITHEELQKISCPVLVMAGDQDIIREEHTVEIFQHIPQAHLCIMPGATHYVPASNPLFFNQMAGNFLSKAFQRPTSNWNEY